MANRPAANRTTGSMGVLMTLLNDTYAMENAIARILENRINDTQDYPLLQAKLVEHLAVTRSQAERVKTCLVRLGGRTAAPSMTAGSILGALQSVSVGALQSRTLKNALADYAVEHFEVGVYKALIAAAELCGDRQTAQVCQDILREEEEMAGWYRQQLPLLVRDAAERAQPVRKAA